MTKQWQKKKLGVSTINIQLYVFATSQSLFVQMMIFVIETPYTYCIMRLIIYHRAFIITNIQIIGLLTREVLQVDDEYVMSILKRIPARIVLHQSVSCYFYIKMYIHSVNSVDLQLTSILRSSVVKRSGIGIY